MHQKKSVWCLTVTSGCSVISGEGMEPITVSSGEAVVVPASVERFRVSPQWKLDFLCASLPVEKVDHPVTTLVEATVGSAR